MANFWKADSKAVANALFRHRHEISIRFPPGATIPDYSVDGCTITYESLRRAAGIGGIARGVGVHLRKVREWCSHNGFPPLDSFVVRKQERDPGDGFSENSGEPRRLARRCAQVSGFSGLILKPFHDETAGGSRTGPFYKTNPLPADRSLPFHKTKPSEPSVLQNELWFY
jgi:hypothetical protein